MSLIPEEKGTSRAVLTIRLLVGGYLLYLDYQLLDSVMQKEGSDRLIIFAFMTLFAIAGIVLVIFSLKGLMRSSDKDGEGDKENETENEDTNR